MRAHSSLNEFGSEAASVLVFDLVRPFGRAPRSRSSGGERPPHTRKVTGSIPVGTTSIVSAPYDHRMGQPSMTDDGRYIVVDGRRWRATDPQIPEERRAELVRILMAWRR